MNRSTEMGGPVGAGFPSTSWSLVQAAQDRSSPEGRQKLEALLAAYWKPIYHHIRVCWKKSNEDTKDLTQAFMVLLLEGNYLEGRTPEHGTLRSYLRTALDHFLVDEHRKSEALKRGGGKQVIAIDAGGAQETLADLSEVPPAEIFDREWTSECIARSIEALQETLRVEGREVYFQVFRLYYLGGSNLEDARAGTTLKEEDVGGSATYESVAAALGLKEYEVRNYLFYTRRRLRTLIEERIRDYSASPSDARDEIRFVLGE